MTRIYWDKSKKPTLYAELSPLQRAISVWKEESMLNRFYDWLFGKSKKKKTYNTNKQPKNEEKPHKKGKIVKWKPHNIIYYATLCNSVNTLPNRRYLITCSTMQGLSFGGSNRGGRKWRRGWDSNPR